MFGLLFITREIRTGTVAGPEEEALRDHWLTHWQAWSICLGDGTVTVGWDRFHRSSVKTVSQTWLWARLMWAVPQLRFPFLQCIKLTVESTSLLVGRGKGERRHCRRML